MPAAVSHRHRVVYFPIPKNATSSVKRLFYELDVGTPFSPETQKSIGCTIHHVYPSPPGKWQKCFPSYMTFAIVRDPVKRFLSAYGNRVIFRRIFEKNPEARRQLEKCRLSLLPELDELVEKLETYMRFSPQLRNHSIPQSQYVGAFWNHLKVRLPIEQISTLPSIIFEATGQTVTLPHEQTSGPKPSPKDLSERHFKKLVSLFATDYEMLKDFYRPSDLPRN